MKTIVLMNQKGGTGKTSISVSLAAELSKKGKTALLDFDPQGNTTAWTTPDDAEIKIEIADILQRKVTAQAALILTEAAGLYLLPTYGIGGDLNAYTENENELKLIKAVKDLLADLAKQGFSFCVIDLSPAFSKLERAAIINGDEVITPILADRFSRDGLETIAANLSDLAGLVDRPIAEYKRIVINGLDGRIKRHAEITAGIKASMDKAIYTLPIDQVFFRAQANSKIIQAMDAKLETLQELARLAADIQGDK